MSNDPNGWPDPERPGRPLNPNRPGWHWLNGRPHLWAVDAAAGWWVIAGNSYGASEMRLSKYGGPCFTLHELRSLVNEAKRQEREKCAMDAELYPGRATRDAQDGIASFIRSRGGK